MILGTRGSPLAMAQSRWIRQQLEKAHPDLEVAIEIIRTTGDEHQKTRGETWITSVGEDGKGIFVKEIEEALLAGRIDLAVHSMKDLPTSQPDGLAVTAIPRREDPSDALVTLVGHDLAGLPRGARIGTGSPRRAAQLLAARPDLAMAPIRGNVGTRFRKMKEGRYDGVILALAGLKRLGAMDDPPGKDQELPVPGMVRALPADVCLPAVGQGALAIETREADSETRARIAVLDDAGTAAETRAERAFLEALGGGCRVPVAALGSISSGTLRLRGVVASEDGRRLIRVEGEGSPDQALALGRRLAEEAIRDGAAELLGVP